MPVVGRKNRPVMGYSVWMRTGQVLSTNPEAAMTNKADLITPTQCRAARELLGWSRFDLARKSGVKAMTISAVERGARVQHKSVSDALRRALEAAGVEFTSADSPSLRVSNSKTQQSEDTR